MALVAAGLTVAYIDFVHVPLTREKAVLEEEIRQNERAVQNVEFFLREHHNENLAEYVDKLKARHDFVLAAMPPKTDFGEFFSSLRKVAAQNGVKINAIKPIELNKNEPALKNDIDGDKVMETTVRISLESDYFSLLKFLDEMRNGGRFVKMSALTVSSNDRQIDCELLFSVYSADISATKE